MSNVYQRIGEAIASSNKISLVIALTVEEQNILRNSGFKPVGTVDVNGSVLEVFEVRPNVQNKELPGLVKRSPESWVNTGPYRATFTPDGGTGVSPTQYRGTTTSVLKDAYDPLSILDDYCTTDNANCNERRVFTITMSDIPSHMTPSEYVNQVKENIRTERK